MSILFDEQLLPTDTPEEKNKKYEKIKNRAKNWYIKCHNHLLILCFDKFKEFDEFGNRLYFYHQKNIISIDKIVPGKGFIVKTIDKNNVEDNVTCLWEAKDSLPRPIIMSAYNHGFISKNKEVFAIKYSREQAINLFKDYNLCFSEGLIFVELEKKLD